MSHCQWKTIIKSIQALITSGGRNDSIMIKDFIKNALPDKLYLSIIYKANTGKRLDLKNPVTFGEKLQWIKLYDRNDIYTMLVDKYEVKRWVASKIGESYVVPTLAVWDKAEEININLLPESFVLKCTHDCGSTLICENKKSIDINEVKKHFKKCLKNDYYKKGREWPYKNVRRRVIAEELLAHDKTEPLSDYKFQCFNGEPKLLLLLQGRGTANFTCDFYDANLELIKDMSQEGLNTGGKQLRGDLLDLVKKARDLSSVLSEGLVEVRVDWYIIDGRVYFGEMTFFDSGGLSPFHPYKYEKALGDALILPN